MSSRNNIYQALRYKLFIIPSAKKKQAAAVARVRERGYARVAFIASSLSMWRQEGIYRLMLEDKEHFRPQIFLIPFITYSEEERSKEMQLLRTHLEAAGLECHEADEFRSFDADIVFYPQFYRRTYEDGLNSADNEDKLLCYSPYGIMMIDEAWQYNKRFHNVAWKLFLQSEYHRALAQKLAFNKGSNAVVAGEARYDEFAAAAGADPWKAQECRKIRVIWSPHHSFGESDRLRRESFLWSAESMMKLAIEYKDRIQFAFKPHPRLLSELYKHPDWGKDRADAFFKFWETSENTQLETGVYTELFRQSDALIHDCNSFIAEYMYTGKAAMFLARNMDFIRSGLNALGNEALDAHYLGTCEDEIRVFLNSLLEDGIDIKTDARKQFRKKYLTPCNPEGFARGVVDDILASLS